MLLPAIFDVIFMFVWLSSFGFVERRLLSCFILRVVSLHLLVFSIHYPLKGWICGKILCKFVFVMIYFGFSLYGIERTSGYSNLGWHLCSIRVCMTSAQALLAFIVSGEKSSVILISLPLYVTRPFPLTAVNIHSFFSTFGVLIIM